MQIQQLLYDATQQLTPHSASPRLDAELLLAHCINHSRTYLFTYPEEEIHASVEKLFLEKLAIRRQGFPIAYLLGEQEFWSLSLKVTQDTLIPRPETELLVECVLAKFPKETQLNVADLGTGSGAIALALASEHPAWQIYATDTSSAALSVAQENASRLKINNIAFNVGHWCDALPAKKFHAIISNPPYLSKADPHLLTEEIRFEPSTALITDNDGLAALEEIISQARNHLLPEGWLFLEHGYNQGEAVCQLLALAHYKNIEKHFDLAGHHRACVAQL